MLTKDFCSPIFFYSCSLCSLSLYLNGALLGDFNLFFFLLPQGVYFYASNPKDFIGFQ